MLAGIEHDAKSGKKCREDLHSPHSFRRPKDKWVEQDGGTLPVG